MSITEPSADPVQPDAGQGEGGSGAQPYAEFLNRVPEEVRGDVEPIFSDWNRSINQRFEEAAQYRKTWEPYQNLGVNQHDPESVQWALAMLSAAQNDPQEVQRWYESYAQERGLTAAEARQAQQDAPTEDLSFLDPSQQFEKLLSEKVTPLEQRLQQYEERWQAQQQEALERQINSVLEAEVAALKEQHAKDYPKDFDFADVVNRFATPHAQPGADPKQVVARAWADFQAVANQLQTAALQAKVDQPAPAEAGGTPDLAPEKVDSLREASRIALEQLRANRAA